MFRDLIQQFFKPIDNSGLVAFRIMMGLLMVTESFGAIATGWVNRVFMTSELTFSFIWFDWLQPLPGNGMYIYFCLMGLISLMVCLGLYYRTSSIILALMWSGVYFMQKTSYNNHYYLMVLVLWFMTTVPAANDFSLDARRTHQRSYSCPNWIRLFFILQMFIVFSFAAINKFSESWASGSFINYVFGLKTNYWLIGPLLGEKWFQTFITYSGLAFDATVIPLLIWKRTRIVAFSGLIFFNLFNSVVFQIGIFPYMVIALTVFFFEQQKVGQFLLKRHVKLNEGVTSKHHPVILVLFFSYFIWQIYLPIRHHFIPGDVTWREEGHRLSWRMMLRSKKGRGNFVVIDKASGLEESVRQQDYLNSKQRRRMFANPDMVWQFAQYLKKTYQQRGATDPEVYCLKCQMSLNGGPYLNYIDDKTDLANVAWNCWGRNNWVLDRPKSN
ncbi:MAG: HTTM domain-containing protein [Bacteroidota bacterium]